MNIRHLEERDYLPIIAVIDQWWGGRPMSDMLPKLFFIHFRDTSFAVEEQGQIIAFLAGFISQTFPDQAYIHFVGIHPEFRKRGLGRQLYERFFGAALERGCTLVRCLTSPVNTGSLAFHMHLGFEVERATGLYMGTPCTLNYGGHGNHRILFVRHLK